MRSKEEAGRPQSRSVTTDLLFDFDLKSHGMMDHESRAITGSFPNLELTKTPDNDYWMKTSSL
jgi:hypothetical protein